MFLVELLLPLYDPQHQPFARAKYDQVRDELAEAFGGVTAFRRSPAEGVWKEEGGSTNYDEVILFEVMVSELDRRWWSSYRKRLEERFEQDEVMIRSSAIDRL